RHHPRQQDSQPEQRASRGRQPGDEHSRRPLLGFVDADQPEREVSAHQLHAGHDRIRHHERSARGWIVRPPAQRDARLRPARSVGLEVRRLEHQAVRLGHQPEDVDELLRLQPGREQPRDRQREPRHRRGRIPTGEVGHVRHQRRVLSEETTMNKRITIVAMLGALTLGVACNDKKFLTEQPFDFIGPQNLYNNAGDALAAINGVYADFINSTGDNYYGRNFVMLVEHPTEMWTSRLSATNERSQPDNYSIPVSHSYVQSVWASAYDAVNRANSVLDHVPSITMDSALKARIIGEAKFLRALHYFNLVRMFGNVPLKLHETVGLDSLAIPQATPQAVYAQIEQDLKDAIAVLPSAKSYTGSDVGRASRGAAKTLLAKVYLQRAGTGVSATPATDWQNALAMA